MRISYSDLQLFKDCPYLFKYLRLERHVLPKSKEQILGTLLHTSFKEILEKVPYFPPLTEILKNFDTRWQQSDLEKKTFDEHEAKTYLADAHRILRLLYDSETRRKTEVLALERGFELPIKDPKTGTTHLITGRIDRIDRLPDSSFLIVDYKTGRSLPNEESIKENLQLAVYHLALERLWPTLIKRGETKVEVALYYVRHGVPLRTSLTKASLAKAQGTILQLVREIEASDFAPKASTRCANFPYYLACPFYKDKFRTEKPKIADGNEVPKVVKEFADLKKQEKTIKQRLVELSAMIQTYLNEQQLEAFFGDQAGIARQTRVTSVFDPIALKKILEPLGRWSDVVTIDSAKLKELLKTLPESLQEKIQEAKIPTGQRSSLRLTKKPLP